MKQTQEIKYGKDVREQILIGINLVADAVLKTLGPGGRTVFIKKDGYQTQTKDGVTVAQAIVLENKYQDVGREALVEAAEKTNDNSGDGTTVTAALVRSMVDRGFAALDSKSNPVELKKGIMKAVEFVIKFLDKIAIPVKGYKMIQGVASISANDKEMGGHIANIFHKLGSEAVIVVEEASIVGYEEEYIKGMQWDKGLRSPYMVTDQARQRAEINNPYILFTNKAIDESSPIVAILNKLSQEKGNKLVVVADDIDKRGLEALVFNNQNVIRNTPQGPVRGNYQTIGVKAPYTQLSQLESLEDMAALTGGKVICEEKGLTLPRKIEDIKDLSFLGRADKVISDPKSTAIIGGKGSRVKVQERIDKIKVELAKETREWEKTKLKERLSRLTGQAVVLRFGAENESIAKEMKYRIEDSINATRNALDEGVVPGGEVAILRASQELEKLIATGDEQRGIDIVRQALGQVIDTLVSNAGNAGSQVVKRILENKNLNFGWDAVKDEYVDLVKNGIIDPVKVVKAAVTNAAATTGMLLTAEVVITDLDKPEENKDKNK